MGHEKQRSESHSNDSEAEFLNYLDNEVPDSVPEGREVPEEEEPDYEKQNRKNEKTKKKRGREDSSTKEHVSEKNEKTKKKGGEDSSPTKNPDLPPPTKRGRPSKPTINKTTVPTLPIFKTTRIRNTGKYVNRSSRKQLPKNKVSCIDCKTYDLEECLLCGKEQHICDGGVVMKIQADYEWLWVCLECVVITADDNAMKNIRETVDKEKKKLEEETGIYTCNLCACKILNQRAIKCNQCSGWVHQKCGGVKDHVTALKLKPTYKCKKCEKKNEENEKPKEQQEKIDMDMGKTILEYNGINITKNDIESTKEGRWLNDSIMSCGLQVLESKYRCKENNITLVDPTITQLIKNHKKNTIKTVIKDIDIKESEWIFFAVSNHNDDLMDTAKLGTGGSHFSLLVYNKKRNTFFDFDPMFYTNMVSVDKLHENLKEFVVKGSKVENKICSQQNNGYDCGPYTLLFTEKLIQKIIEGEDISTTRIKVDADEAKGWRLNLQNIILNMIKAQGKGNNDYNTLKDKGKDGSNLQPPSSGNEDNTKKNKTLRDNTNSNSGDKGMDRSNNINMGKGNNNTPCWHHNNRICKFGINCTKTHKPVCEQKKAYGVCRDQKCKLLHQKVCRQYFSFGYCTNNNKCWYTHPLKRWQNDSTSLNGLSHGNNRDRSTYGYQNGDRNEYIYGQQGHPYGEGSYNSQNDHHSYRNMDGGSRGRQSAHQGYPYGTQWDKKGQPNGYQNEYVYGQQGHPYGDGSYNNQNDHRSYRNRDGGSRDRQSTHRDYSYGTQWDNKGQPNFLERKHASMDMRQMVIEMMGAMKKMNAGMERLERGQVNRWTH